MGAVWARARAELRRRWKATVILTVLVGLVAGVAMFGVAGARRTASAMERLIDYHRPYDVYVFGEGIDLDAVGTLPQVADVDTQSYLLLAPSTPEGDPDPGGSLNPFLTTRGTAGVTSQRPIVVAGRLPRPDAPLEIAVNEDLTRRQRVGVGDILRVWAYGPEQFFEVLEAPGTVDPTGPALDLQVTGVVRHPFDISPDTVDDEVAYSAIQSLYLSPAFANRHGDEVASFESLLGPALVVRLAGGAADLPAFTQAVGALPGGGDAEVRRTSRVVERLAGAGAPASAIIGVRMAVEPGQGAGAVPVRSALLGATVAVATVAAGLAFTASLDRMVATPALQGWTWDVTVGDETVDIHDKGRRLLGDDPLVESFSAISGSGYLLDVDGSRVGVTGLDRIEGDAGPPVVEGRLPGRGGEVDLGPRTIEQLDVAVGDEIEVTAADGDGGDGSRAATMEVVGIALLGPALNYTATIGEGALVGLADMQELFGEVPTAYFLVDYAEGADPGAAFASLQADWGRQVLRPLPAPDVENLRRVDGLPVAFSALVTVLGVTTLGHTLTTSVRRRRRDVAVLRAIGFARSQISATVAWQATTTAVIALAVGLPLGVGAGRWAWQVVADGIGAPAAAVTPALAIALTVPVVVLVANALAARAAGRIRPAVALRAE